MPSRAIDFHVHLPTPDWLDGSMAGYVEAAEAYFRSPVQRQSLDELAARYRGLGLTAVLLAWDAETATGRPRVPNETVAAACRDYPDVFTGLGSVDPHKDSAVSEVASIAALGLRGVKFHPSLQAFAPDDPRYWPIFAACQEHGLLALFHTGTSGIGARRPGGQGIRIDLAHPLKLDPVAAAHPDLTVVAAHFGWPWHMDLIAIALHKTNVYIDISGWSPRRIPPEVIRELRGRLSGQFLWGSDYPLLTPERGLAEFDELDLPADVARAVLHDNAARILGLVRSRSTTTRRVVGRGVALARLPVHVRAGHPAGHRLAGVDQVDAHAHVLGEGARAVVPVGERVRPLHRLGHDVVQPEGAQVGQRLPFRRGDVGRPDEHRRVPHVGVGRRHVEVARHH